MRSSEAPAEGCWAERQPDAALAFRFLRQQSRPSAPGEMFEAACKLGRLEATDRAVQVGAVQKLDQGAESEVAAYLRISDETIR